MYQVMTSCKGAYVVHMLDMMYWTPAFGDRPFKLAMQKFVRDFAGKTARTEDFKAAMERSMTHTMDLQFNGRLDWFFNEYVYGTALPHYEISSEFTVDNKGITSVRMRLTQSNVSPTFVMLIPLYLQVKGGETHRIQTAVVHGNATIDQTFILGKLSKPAEAMLINYNSDVLSDN
jgi:aminopeptidase N